MSDSSNVFIFGAGASYNAGIPLLGEFMEAMWRFPIKQRINGEMIVEKDHELFCEISQIKKQLGCFHTQADFDEWNIEDILSILSFNEMVGSKESKSNLPKFTNAIAKTIELTCKMKLRESGDQGVVSGTQCYYDFWVKMLKWREIEKRLPTIITFNYDLVFERALMNVLNDSYFGSTGLPFDGLRLKYHYGNFEEQSFKLNSYVYAKNKSGQKLRLSEQQRQRKLGKVSSHLGTILEEGYSSKPLNVDILKLHGSVNFPRAKKTKDTKELSLAMPVNDPLILPPIFNKMVRGNEIDSVWSKALNVLRNAKRVFFVGYSLPQTDIYMQYFLKSALGPNSDLHKVYVFDPVLFRDNDRSNQMRLRYSDCFSKQLNSRIEFNPDLNRMKDFDGDGGTFEHFVDLLGSEKSILF